MARQPVNQTQPKTISRKELLFACMPTASENSSNSMKFGSLECACLWNVLVCGIKKLESWMRIINDVYLLKRNVKMRRKYVKSYIFEIKECKLIVIIIIILNKNNGNNYNHNY